MFNEGTEPWLGRQKQSGGMAVSVLGPRVHSGPHSADSCPPNPGLARSKAGDFTLE